MTTQISLANARPEVRNKFMAGVYRWMLVALVISAVSAYVTAHSPMLLNLIFGSSFGFIIIVFAELGLVMYLVSRIRTMSVGKASLFFVLYSVLNGVTLSSVVLVYTATSITQVFLTTALMFGCMSFYGMKTTANLNSVGRYLSMALIGIVIASLLNFLFRSSSLEWLISIATVVVFTGLTAYDTQKLMNISIYSDGSENFQKVAIIGALELYLDFINIFLALLRLFGRSKN